jgi:hypothetical protein
MTVELNTYEVSDLMHAYEHYASKAMTRSCPTCRRPVEIIELFTLQSTEGPVRHVKVRCPGGHAYHVLMDEVTS